MRTSAIMALIFFVVVTTAGCHTIHGVGKDVESAGRTIQKASD